MNTATLEQLREGGFFEGIDFHFASTLAGLAKETDEEVLLAAALASRQTRAGHVCASLERLGGQIVAGDTGPLPCVWPEAKAWQQRLARSALCGRGRERRPLVLDESGRLYLHRYYEHEVRLATLLRTRASAPQQELDERLLEAGLTKLFGAKDDDGQRNAAVVALRRRLAVISGGPGTGKTSTVVRILALLIEQALAAGSKAPRVLLVAPTGKAAARLVESIQGAKSKLDVSAEVRAGIVEEASTIHRALGVMRDSASRFHRNAERPLVADVVIVDEASMVDLALMRSLVEAVPPEAKLVLLGDRHQLASVEAGSVLSELCRAAHGLNGCVIELLHSYRFASDSGIGAVSTAVRGGDVGAVFESLAAGKADVSFTEMAPERALSPALARRVVEGYRAYLRSGTPAEALEALGTFRVLCGHRRGYAGVEHLNGAIRVALAEATLVPPRGEFYRGRPVLVTQNDYSVGLFNGDVGLTWPNPRGELRVYFLGSDGALRELSPARLPAHESAFALSVHKSQGSEHDEIALVLPELGSPLLTRELLYTAITRAKKRAHLFGQGKAIEAAVREQVVRESGLAEALLDPG